MKGGLLAQVQYHHLPGTLTLQNHTQSHHRQRLGYPRYGTARGWGSSDKQAEAVLIYVPAPVAGKRVYIWKISAKTQATAPVCLCSRLKTTLLVPAFHSIDGERETEETELLQALIVSWNQIQKCCSSYCLANALYVANVHTNTSFRELTQCPYLTGARMCKNSFA